MENINNKNKRQNGKSKSKRSCKSDDEETAMEVVAEPRVLVTRVKGHRRTSSISSNLTDELSRPGTSGKRRKHETDIEIERMDDFDVSGGGCLAAVAEERKELEKFLFEEGNKVSRPVIKYILEKWAAMESRLQSALVENEILKERNKRMEIPEMEKMTFAQAAAMRIHESCPQGTADPKKKVSPQKKKYEVVLIKPEKEDRRNNEQIKEEALKKLEGVRKNLKVRNIGQMRK